MLKTFLQMQSSMSMSLKFHLFWNESWHPQNFEQVIVAFEQEHELMNCFCRMVDRRKASSLISSRDHCQRSSPSRISDMPWAGFEPVQNLSSGFDEWSCAVVNIYFSKVRSYNLKDTYLFIVIAIISIQVCLKNWKAKL